MARHRALPTLALVVGAGSLAGCAAFGAGPPPTASRLAVPPERAWQALEAEFSARMTVLERDPARGRIVAVTPLERVSTPAAGARALVGRRVAHIQRRRVAALVETSDGACRLELTAWLQRYRTSADRELALIGHDPMDLALSAGEPLAAGSADSAGWVDLRRDRDLELTLLQAVEDRLKSR